MMGSFDNIKNFYDYLSKNQELQKKVSSKVLKTSNEDTAMNIIANIAKKHNFIFSAAELKEFIKDESEILSAPSVDNSQLANVAGGKNEFSEEI